MAWTVIKEDEHRNPEKELSSPFQLNDNNIIYKEGFKVLKYLDPYGDTTFNARMANDLIIDLGELKKISMLDNKQIEELIQLAYECTQEVHSYLTFYGD